MSFLPFYSSFVYTINYNYLWSSSPKLQLPGFGNSSSSWRFKLFHILSLCCSCYFLHLLPFPHVGQKSREVILDWEDRNHWLDIHLLRRLAVQQHPISSIAFSLVRPMIPRLVLGSTSRKSMIPSQSEEILEEMILVHVSQRGSCILEEDTHHFVGNYVYDKINSDKLAPPGTDHGQTINAQWPMG